MYRQWLIALLGLSLCISISATQAVFLLVFVDTLWRRKNLSGATLLWPLLAFFGWLLLGTLISNRSAMGDALSMASAILFYFVIATGFHGKESRALLAWFCVAAALAGFLGLVQKFSGVNYLPNETVFQVPDSIKNWPKGLLEIIALRNERAVGPRSHPLTYAESLMPAFFLWAAWLGMKMREKNVSYFKVATAALGLLLVVGGLVFAEGRAVLMAIFFGSMIFGWFLGRRAFFTMTFLVVVGFALSFALSPRFRGRVLSVVSTQQGTWGDQQSKSTRYSLWTSAASQIADRPIQGFGVDGGTLVTIDPVNNTPRRWSETHNIFLQTALESGVVGLGLFVWIFICIFRMAVRLSGSVRAAFTACLVCFLIAGFTESWTNDKEISMLFWTLIGTLESFLKETNETA